MRKLFLFGPIVAVLIGVCSIGQPALAGTPLATIDVTNTTDRCIFVTFTNLSGITIMAFGRWSVRPHQTEARELNTYVSPNDYIIKIYLTKSTENCDAGTPTSAFAEAKFYTGRRRAFTALLTNVTAANPSLWITQQL